MKGCVCVKKSTRILAVSLALCLGLGTAALAAGGTRTIEVLTGMKVLVNGEEFTPTDVNGSAVDVFAYNGTTYVPIRAMSEAFGLEVGYDAAQQAAVVNGTAGSSVTAPDTRDVVYILSHAPEEITLEDGTTETFYNEIYEELRWQLEDPDMGFEAEIVSGTLPAGITYNEADRVFEGRFEAAETQDVVVRFTPRGGEAFELTYRFVINDDGFNAAPVVIWGVEGDQVESYIPTAYNGILYTGDDLSSDPADPVTGGWGSSPIGTQEALDALAEYGLTIDYETRTDDDEYYWADNFVSGTLKGSTDGWVKISVPVYAGMGASSDSGFVENGELQPGSWFVTGYGADGKVLYGNVDIYLNIIPLGD